MNKYDNQKQEEAILAIDLWREINLSQVAFCRREGISRSTFQHSRRRYDDSYEFRPKKSEPSKTKNKESFITVSLSSPEPKKQSELQIFYDNGVRIICPSDLHILELQKLITLQDF